MASRTNVVTGEVAEYSIWRVILASSVGTMIEWYDFYIFGSLTAVLAQVVKNGLCVVGRARLGD